jgi:hypothetical protein
MISSPRMKPHRLKDLIGTPFADATRCNPILNHRCSPGHSGAMIRSRVVQSLCDPVWEATGNGGGAAGHVQPGVDVFQVLAHSSFRHAEPAGDLGVGVPGGMPGWQIALIAVGAALVAATLAVVLDRALAARKVHATTA